MQIYSKVEDVKDISRINCIIRDEMLEVEDVSHLSELKKRSDYLCTLTFSPFWKKKFKDKIKELQEVAILENRATVKEANLISEYKGFNKTYHPWKQEIDVEEELKKIPNEVIEEISTSALTLEASIEILEDIRVLFCDIRKALLFCEDESCLKQLKRGVDIISLLPHLEDFAKHFEENLLKEIDELINLEKERSIELLNIISAINSFDSHFEAISSEELNEDADSLIQKLLQEEEKAQSYIPTEAKYKGGAKVLWVVYYNPKRKREYAKRVYLPSEYRNLTIKGPGEFENRFKNRVWGIELIYESKVEATTIKVRGKEIKLPTRWIKRKKVITLPKDAQNVRVLEEKPPSAMDIA